MTNGFYAEQMKDEYEQNDGWPDDAIELTDAEYNQFSQPAPDGKILSAIDGRPSWIDTPPPTADELVAMAELDRLRRIDQANDFMNGKQWPGKAAIGRLKGGELEQYGLWLDYLDALDAVDTSSSPDIDWPTPPAEQAS